KMAPNPIVFACSNPDPEIAPALAHEVRDDLIMSTGRSDFPNQVNNVLGFPFIFRGALDVRSTVINEEMKLAAAYSIAALAKEPVTQEVLTAYELESLEFGREYIIPKATDSRLLGIVSNAVAQAAIDTGVATLPLPANYPLKSISDI
ncbi:MAG: malic enzyme-like NAD(P)-binding protein, partial [Bermanella sp.]